MMICPKCQHQRKPTDTAPEWQCPACGVAYNKVAPAASPRPTPRAPVRPQTRSGGLPVLPVILIALAAAAGYYHFVFHKPAVTAAPVAAAAGQVAPTDPAMAQAESDFKANNDAPALATFMTLANAGNAVAQQHVGHMYAYGIGVAKDHAQGMAWLNKAAAQGNTGAMLDLGFIDEQGDGEPQDHVKAAEWYRQAAEANDCVGMTSLAWLYGSGDGVTKNPEFAYVLLAMAQHRYQADPVCTMEYTWIPRGKLGPNPFLPEAVLQNPADLANKRSEHSAFWALADLNNLGATLSPDQLARAKARADAWKPGQSLAE